MLELLKRLFIRLKGRPLILDLEPSRARIRQEMLVAISEFRGKDAITRVDVEYDLVSMDVKLVRLYLDTHPTGEPQSGESKTFDLLELELPEWAEACHAVGEKPVKVQYSGKTRHAVDEETLCEPVGLFLLEIILSLRDDGTLSKLPCAEKCYIGVGIYDGVWGWPNWKDRGKHDLV